MKSTKSQKVSAGTVQAQGTSGLNRTITLLFLPGEDVWIRELGRPGKCTAAYMYKSDILYNVRYFDNSEIKNDSFYGEELSAKRSS